MSTMPRLNVGDTFTAHVARPSELRAGDRIFDPVSIAPLYVLEDAQVTRDDRAYRLLEAKVSDRPDDPRPVAGRLHWPIMREFDDSLPVIIIDTIGGEPA